MTETALLATSVRAVMSDPDTVGIVGTDKRGDVMALVMDAPLAWGLVHTLLRLACEAGGSIGAPTPDEDGGMDVLPADTIHLVGSLEDGPVVLLGFGRAAVPAALPRSELRKIGTELLRLADVQDAIARPGRVQ